MRGGWLAFVGYPLGRLLHHAAKTGLPYAGRSEETGAGRSSRDRRGNRAPARGWESRPRGVCGHGWPQPSAHGRACSVPECGSPSPSPVLGCDAPRLRPVRAIAQSTRWLALALIALILQGCVTATVDEMTFNEPTEGIGDRSVVILGRRHAADYETEFDFIECIGNHIRRSDNSITVIDEVRFINDMYPWFEPRIAPMRSQDIERLLTQKPVAARFDELKLEYMIWIDGKTIETNSAGSMTCAVGPGGAGCFGFGTWGNASDYEATIWNFTDQAEVGKVSAATSGQSYMPAVVVPIPIIAPVQSTACESLGDQLLRYLSAEF